MGDDIAKKRPSLIFTTLKSVAAVATISWLAANWMSAGMDRPALTQLVATVSNGADPTTTGSIGSRASATRLDPCVTPKR